MPSSPMGWRVFGDPPEDGHPVGNRPDGDAFDLEARPEPAPRPATRSGTLADLIGQGRAAPWLAVVCGGGAVIVFAAIFLAVALGTSSDHADAVVIADRPDAVRSTHGARPVAVATDAGAALVDVEGAVVKPGLRRVPSGSRVGDAIAAAGGYSSSVDLGAAATTLNLAAPIADGDKIRVPSLAEGGLAGRASTRPDGAAADGSSGLIDLNHADEPALESLPGIGPATAANIVAARSTQPFASLDDAQSRKVLSAAIVEQIRALATVTP